MPDFGGFSRTDPPIDCEATYGPGYVWSWELGKCIFEEPSTWWTEEDDEEEGIPSGMTGGFSAGLSASSLFSSWGTYEEEEDEDWWSSSAPEAYESDADDTSAPMGEAADSASENPSMSYRPPKRGPATSYEEAIWNSRMKGTAQLSTQADNQNEGGGGSYPTATGVKTDGVWYNTGIRDTNGSPIIIWLSDDDAEVPHFDVDVPSFDPDGDRSYPGATGTRTDCIWYNTGIYDSNGNAIVILLCDDEVVPLQFDVPSFDSGYTATGSPTYANKACEEGLPIPSDFIEGTIALLDIIAPDADDWENEVEGSILMDSDFDSTFSLDSVVYTSGFESGESMDIAFTAFSDLWGEENHIYWDYMDSSEYAPVFAHSYYDEDSEPVDAEYLAEGYTTVKYYSQEQAALKERFGGDYTWAELIDSAISSLYTEISARSYDASAAFLKHRYDIFKFGVFTSLPFGEQVSLEASDLGTRSRTGQSSSGTSSTY
jgi:hypothetical protein